jgi:hypothetical protein
LSIETYLQSLLNAVANAADVASSDIALDKRGPQAGLIRGNIYFVDGTRLHFRELVDFETEPPRLMYSYHYQNEDASIIFRYDDTPHHIELPNSPHHKHVGSAQNTIPSSAPDLSTVLMEINRLRFSIDE